MGVRLHVWTRLYRIVFLDAQLACDHFDVSHWVGLVVVVDDVIIFKSAHDVYNTIDRVDVRQEGVAETGTCRGNNHKALKHLLKELEDPLRALKMLLRALKDVLKTPANLQKALEAS